MNTSRKASDQSPLPACDDSSDFYCTVQFAHAEIKTLFSKITMDKLQFPNTQSPSKSPFEAIALKGIFACVNARARAFANVLSV